MNKPLLSAFLLWSVLLLCFQPTGAVAQAAGGGRPVFELLRGYFYFFTRGQPTDIDFRNRLATAAARGTEFAVSIDDNDRIEITVFDGVVDLSNPQGSVTMTNNEQGVALPG